VAHPKRRKTAGGGGGYRGSATKEAQWPIGPRTTCRGIALPPRWTLLYNRSMSQEDGRRKRRAVDGSLAPWRTYQNEDMEHEGGGGAIADQPGMGDPRPAI